MDPVGIWCGFASADVSPSGITISASNFGGPPPKMLMYFGSYHHELLGELQQTFLHDVSP